MPSSEPLIFSRCPVLASTAGVAAQLGYLDNDAERRPGLDIILRQQSAEPRSAQDPALHPTRYWLRHGPNLKALWARSQGSDDHLLGVSWFHAPDQIHALPGSGIRTPADLKGKRLAVPTQKDYLFDGPRATALRTYEVALGTVGLTLDDVELVELPVPNLAGGGKLDWADPRVLWTIRRRAARNEFWLQALREGKADVATSHISFAIEGAAVHGVTVVFDAANLEDRSLQAGPAVPLVLVASGALLRERREALVGLLADLVRASRWSKENPGEALRLTARDLGSDELTVEYTYGPELGENLDVDFDPRTLAALDAVKDSLVRHGTLPRNFALEDWIDRGPLEEALQLVESEETNLVAA